MTTTTATRLPGPRDFNVDVEGIGTFTFGWRGMRDEVRIQAHYSRLIQGTQPSEWLSAVSGWLSVLEVLTVHAPADWDLWALDPLDEASYTKLAKVHAALREKEGSFRRKGAGSDAAGGQGAGENGGVLAPQAVQPGTE